MNPQHREFFIRLRALCREYQASIGAGSNELRFYIGGIQFTIPSGIAAHCRMYVTELKEEMLEASEEPQP